MTPVLPPPLRAAAGLAARSLDEVLRLPQTLVALPIRFAGAAMQASLRLQQEYAGLVARGDELLLRFGGTDDNPAWATFDEDPADGAAPGGVVVDFPSTTADSPPDLEDTLVLEDPPPLAAFDDDDVLPAVTDPLDEVSGPGLPPVDDAVEVDRLEPPPPVAPYEPVPTPPVRRPPRRTAPTRSPRTPRADLGRVRRGQGRAAVAPFLTATPEEPAGRTSAFDRALREDPPLPAGPPGSGPDGPGAAGGTVEPVPGYDGWSVPQLRARLRGLSAGQLTEMLAYEDLHQARAPYLTMLQNRLVAIGTD